jgi:hypothetical protein
MEHRGAVAQHLPKVGAAESALIATAGFPKNGLEIPARGTGRREQVGEQDSLTHAPVDPELRGTGHAGSFNVATIGQTLW